jgi:hypothetical protein
MNRIANETGVWTYLRSKLGYMGHFSRIETGATTLGQPDVNFCVDGIEGNLELKFAKGPKDALHLRPSQHRWMTDRIKAGSWNVWILAHVAESNKWMVVHGMHSKWLIQNPKRWEDKATRVWDDGINIEELLNVLTKGK